MRPPHAARLHAARLHAARFFAALGAAVLAGCSACGEASPAPPPSPGPANSTLETTVAEPAVGPGYEVHEWGLVRSAPDDGLMLSGPRAVRGMALAKPVLYFHRADVEGELSVEVTVAVPGGSVVEHWPSGTLGGAGELRWRGLRVEAEPCLGGLYPSPADPACAALDDECEASELLRVETDDSSCLRGGDGEPRNHLFYRGALPRPPALPLAVEALGGGRVRVTHRGTDPLPGRLLRLFHPAGDGSEAALITAPPAPGGSVELDPPRGPVPAAAAALTESLQEAGLTEAEAAAFRRAWDPALFGELAGSAQVGDAPGGGEEAAAESPRPLGDAETRAGMGGLLLPPEPRTTLLYVLPTSVADSLASVSFEPPPASFRRVIVVWIDEAGAAQ